MPGWPATPWRLRSGLSDHHPYPPSHGRNRRRGTVRAATQVVPVHPAVRDGAEMSVGANIPVRHEDGEFTAYLSRPRRPNGVAVLVLQEIFGVNDNIRAICDRLADAGFAAIAPDLYWRQAPGVELDPAAESGRSRAMQLMKGLDREQSVRDARAALDAARALIGGLVRSAAVGYCFGGGVAYLLAVRGEVEAGVAYYGTYIHTLLGEAAGLPGRLLLHIAGDDHLCPPDAQAAIERALAPVRDRAEVIVYAGAGHAFARIGGATYDAVAARRADDATFALLDNLARQVQ